jgi:hypothetical protein
LKGEPGVKGTSGLTGERGSKGIPGNTGPIGLKGNLYFYLHLFKNLYRWGRLWL